MMNGALYISFFQGQLESALEQVVQLAVQEITKTVGASLNSMLLETAAKDQENQRLRLKLQSRQFDCGEVGNASFCRSNTGEDSPSEETKVSVHTNSQSSEHAMHTNTYRLEQKGRAVDQLRTVMDRVLKFAVNELTKIVEDSFDDLLLEMMKKEKENCSLQLRLSVSEAREEAGAKLSSDTAGSPSGSGSSEKDEETRKESQSTRDCGTDGTEPADATAAVAERQTVLSVAQDWVPILDKVFGQKWCSDLWEIKELESGAVAASVPDPEGLVRDNPGSSLSSGTQEAALAEINGRQSLWPRPDRRVGSSASPDSQGASVVSPTGSSPPSVLSSASGSQSHGHPGDDLPLRSPSMLHRLLTLCGDTDVEALPAPSELQDDDEPPVRDEPSPPVEKERASVGAERSAPAGRKAYPCRECGKKFGRLHLLKAHQHSHAEPSPLRCAQCGKRFSQNARLQAHLRTHAKKKT